ncbi:PIN domain-containing protein [Lysinibacillus sp. BW-2-10]|uniref:PIN domain-containing protein n=1 Tax=Lysinibacillus sp. BW-2-10 TaxID=2590030 RepID=UPI00117D3EC4|nr:PIN domain-containing protein [Lysinibacillus sp. BW-2-10]TSI04518.1 hypothetical protein FJQ64_14205 [Lysinibacillus sp. BW-2-10]
MSIFDSYLYVDFENVQDLKVDVIKKTTKIMIIVGENQTKMPLELIQKTQPLGNAVEWIQVNGKGRNALDFFIAFYLGRDVAVNKGKTFIIYSKDTGYDPLIDYLKKSGIKVKRIVNFQELSVKKPIKTDETRIQRVKESLIKTAGKSRPKKKSSLIGFIGAQHREIAKKDIESIVEQLFRKKIVYEENGMIKYSFQ